MFPHTSLLMMQHSKQKFAIVDKMYFVNQEVSKKGGYNLFRVFAVDYLNIMKLAESNKIISEITFEKIKQDLFSDFLVSWYCNTKICKNNYTFSLDKIGESLCVYYGKTGFYKLQLFSYLYFFKSKLLSGYNKMKIKVKKEK
ncbi:hypothetical protein [Flavobacterium sp. YO12]|uniref:hypothetical protein n=1 Tax=Flavobacterium sp. YO12 TaxID=1920029 RepID=UPI00100B384D|nr:hypothetical protein [Flavobacterium sp. YO12]RXM42306.1 hypothetical protein BOW55_20720 [Flavobacterium sp. YO12]